jgi:hypothetical protein
LHCSKIYNVMFIKWRLNIYIRECIICNVGTTVARRLERRDCRGAAKLGRLLLPSTSSSRPRNAISKCGSLVHATASFFLLLRSMRRWRAWVGHRRAANELGSVAFASVNTRSAQNIPDRDEGQTAIHPLGRAHMWRLTAIRRLTSSVLPPSRARNKNHPLALRLPGDKKD